MSESQMETLWEKKENLRMVIILKKEIWSPLQKRVRLGGISKQERRNESVGSIGEIKIELF
jgi:hypothetical protein